MVAETMIRRHFFMKYVEGRVNFKIQNNKWRPHWPPLYFVRFIQSTMIIHLLAVDDVNACRKRLNGIKVFRNQDSDS